jgi:diguanylate cyclase (GGDEF)-like protein/PAS domain S-box-containing protein
MSGMEDAKPAPCERLEVLWKGARDGLWDWNLTTDELRVSTRWKAIVGVTDEPSTLGPDAWFKRVHPRDLEELKGAIQAHCDGETPELDHQCRMLHADGGWRWVLAHGRLHPNGQLLGGSLTDITAQKSSEDRLIHELAHDPLTGLPNRALFLDRLAQSFQRTQRRGGLRVAVLYLDLDRFHNINDSLGVEAGDELLLRIADGISSLMRLGDTFGRLGGDEFGIILDGVRGSREAMRFAEEVGRILRTPRRLQGHDILSSGSIGIALSMPQHERSEDLLRDALSAMHRAKQDGATLFEMFDPEMNDRARERLSLEGDLHRALGRNEFLLHYQPIVSFKTGLLNGFEALVRWQHPTRGLVRPDDFIPVAEETGLIVDLGKWVLTEACRQMEEWRGRHPSAEGIAISVNLSGRQFQDPNLIDEIAGVLKSTSLDPRGLKLEMTESVVMEHSRGNAETLQSMRDLGVALLIDDFGTGYSSLASLRNFPLDALKIDRSFVSQMEFEEEKAEIVRIILTLASKLGLDVVAEGVETARELEMLRGLECQLGQGYYFAAPFNSDSAEAWIENSPRW